jgi:hypothetical protein
MSTLGASGEACKARNCALPELPHPIKLNAETERNAVAIHIEMDFDVIMLFILVEAGGNFLA